MNRETWWATIIVAVCVITAGSVGLVVGARAATKTFDESLAAHRAACEAATAGYLKGRGDRPTPIYAGSRGAAGVAVEKVWIALPPMTVILTAEQWEAVVEDAEPVYPSPEDAEEWESDEGPPAIESVQATNISPDGLVSVRLGPARPEALEVN